MLVKRIYTIIRISFLDRHKGLGEWLLLFALDDCIHISDYVGFNFVVLEALESSVGFFEKQKFSKVKKNNDLQIMAIKLEAIKFQLGSVE